MLSSFGSCLIFNEIEYFTFINLLLLSLSLLHVFVFYLIHHSSLSNVTYFGINLFEVLFIMFGCLCVIILFSPCFLSLVSEDVVSYSDIAPVTTISIKNGCVLTVYVYRDGMCIGESCYVCDRHVWTVFYDRLWLNPDKLNRDIEIEYESRNICPFCECDRDVILCSCDDIDLALNRFVAVLCEMLSIYVASTLIKLWLHGKLFKK